MRTTRKTPEVHVPRFVGLMAMDAREAARAQDLALTTPDRPDLPSAVVDYVVRQYPQPGAEVPRGSTVYVWFDLGEGEGGGGMREPRMPPPPRGGLRRELTEPREHPPIALGTVGVL
ncbi:PASTA domain-containing protein [Streptomyces poriticola]|uniref:PASTA domain-containing protein n=1 Tax=Streptomyces poriticola TaxID=3120506 RepID=UPI002FCE4E8A